MSDTERKLKEFQRLGYVRPGSTCGDWSRFYRELGGRKWSRYVLYVEGETIEYTARDDKAALQYVKDTYIPGTEFELFERVCTYRKVNND